MINSMFFTKEKIKSVIDEEYRILRKINKKYSSINEYNKASKNDNEEIIKDGIKYKLISDGDVMEIFDTKKDAEKFLKKEKTRLIRLTNSLMYKLSDEHYTARLSLLFDNLQKASDEVNGEVVRLLEINNSVNKKSELICVGNHVYFNMGDNYIKMNIHNLEKTTVKEVDCSDFVITKDIK